jgi:16S rRNA (guanine1516-N2)-methyltransferase
LNLSSVAVACETPLFQAKTAALADQLGLPLVAPDNQDFYFLLVQTTQHLELRNTNNEIGKAITLDFLHGALDYRRQHLRHRKELIAKAVGIKNSVSLTVLDTTAGLGRDAFILACLGADVLMLERSGVISALLQDALARLFSQPEWNDKIKLRLLTIDAKIYLAALEQEDYPDVIYLDPMYPTRNKSALVKKDMRMLRAIAGHDEDAVELFNLALTRARKRVVVKRPRLAANLTDLQPQIIFSGQHSRFDVYIRQI